VVLERVEIEDAEPGWAGWTRAVAGGDAGDLGLRGRRRRGSPDIRVSLIGRSRADTSLRPKRRPAHLAPRVVEAKTEPGRAIEEAKPCDVHVEK
jgi:hypothetical protein